MNFSSLIINVCVCAMVRHRNSVVQYMRFRATHMHTQTLKSFEIDEKESQNVISSIWIIWHN